MTVTELRSLPIVVDPDKDFLKSIKSDPQAKDLPPLLASTATEALKLISLPGITFSAVFLNPDLQAPYSLDIIQALQKRHPNSPIYFLSAKNRAALSSAELENLAVQKVIQKPATYTEMLRTAKILPVLFDADEAMQIANSDENPIGVDQKLPDSDFFEVPLNKFVSGTTLLFNVYKKSGPAVYQKAFKAGDVFEDSLFGGRDDPDAVIHLTMNVHSHYLKYNNWLCAALIGKLGIPFEIKLGFVLWMGEQVVYNLYHSKNPEDSVQNAEYFVERLRELIQDADCNNTETLKSALLKFSATKPEVIASLVSILLVKRIDYRSMRSYKVVGLTSLLQNAPGPLLDRLNNILDPSILQTLRIDEKDRKHSRFKGTVFEIVESGFQFANVLRKATTLRELNFRIDSDILPQHKKVSQVIDAFRKSFLKFNALSN